MNDIATSAACRRQLCQALQNWLPAQRWFAGKSKTIANIEIADLAELPSLSDGRQAVLAFVAITFTDGSSDHYVLPLENRQDAAAQVGIVQLPSNSGPHTVCDATTPEYWQSLVKELFGSNQELPTSSGGTIRSTRTKALDLRKLLSCVDADLQVHAGQQSNTAVYIGQDYFLKLFRRPPAGVNPDVEIGTFLTERVRFANTPAVAGYVDYATSTGESRCLAILSTRLQADSDAWTLCLRQLSGFWKRLSDLHDPARLQPVSIPWQFDRAPIALPADASRLLDDSLSSAETLGRRTGEMHSALALERTDPAFAPEPISHSEFSRLISGIRSEIATTERLLKDRAATIRALKAESFATEFAHRADILLSSLTSSEQAPSIEQIRVHGDYHLGQVLSVGRDFYIIDFEGEPDRPLAERRAKRPALKDVAGMVRSFHYASNAAAVGLLPGLDSLSSSVNIAAWQQFWFQSVTARFLSVYREVTSGTRLLPADPREAQRLLDVFILEKALYELRYELNNRPDWARIPLIGLAEVLSIEFE